MLLAIVMASARDPIKLNGRNEKTETRKEVVDE
jgi:hypothetical protein